MAGAFISSRNVLGVWYVLDATDADLSDYPYISQVLNGSVCMYYHTTVCSDGKKTGSHEFMNHKNIKT